MFKTLIVEDNSTFRRIVKGILLSRFPFIEVEEAGDGEEALQKVSDSFPNLILMDIKLPGENGLQLTKKIKKSHPYIPIVIFTSYNFPEYREVAEEYGADGFFVKGSVSSEEIASLVESFLNQS